MDNKNNKSSLGSFVSGAMAAAALGGYLLFGSKNAKRNRNKVENWVDTAKSEVLGKVKKIKKLSKEKYYEAIDAVSDKYAEIKEVGKEKSDEFRDELKKYWQELEQNSNKNNEE